MQFKKVIWVIVKGFFLAVITALFFFFILFGFERVFKIFDEDIKKESLTEEHLFRMAGEFGDRMIREDFIEKPDVLQEYLLKNYPSEGNTEIDYIDGTYTIVASNVNGRKGVSIIDSELFKKAEIRAIQDSYQVGVKSKFDGDNLLLGVSIPLIYKRAIHGVILVREKIPSDQKKILFIFKKVFYFLIIVFVLAFLYVVFSSYQKALKIKILSSFARQVVNGELEKRILLEGADDFSSLADSFNTIIENLEQRVQESEDANNRLSLLNKNLEEANEEKQRLYEQVNNMNKELSVKVKEATFELRETVGELRNLKIFNDYIFNSITVGILVLKDHGVIEFANREAKKNIAKFYKDEILGGDFSIVFGNIPLAVQLLENMKETDKQVQESELQVQVGENLLHFLFSMEYLRGDNGEILGIVVLMINITDKKILEEQFLRNKRLASLGQLAAGVAHEIRNPLGAIRGFAELLKKKDLKVDKKDYYLDTIINEVQHLNELVTNVLDFARPSIPNFKRISLEDIINSLLQLCGDIFEKSNVELHVDVEKDLPLVEIDSTQIRQVLINLLKNASESFSNQELRKVGIKIFVSNNGVKIKIEDNGDGISDIDKENIFNPFFSTKDDGTGLGLAIVNKIVENHRGRIDVESEKGKGTVFNVFLPLRQQKG